MKKIISLFQRNYDGDRLVRDEVVPGAEWVTKGEGIATRKWDGTCCMIRGGKLYKRYDAKHGKQPPEGFEPAQDYDPITGHMPGWLLVGEGPEDKYFPKIGPSEYPDGTYELIGPKINGNKERVAQRLLLKHGLDQYPNCPRSYKALKDWFRQLDIEGVVWHHPDGRMVKIKKKDFGLKREEVL